MVAAAPALDLPVEIDEPVTGYGNEALWDEPKVFANPVKVAAASPQR